jgi:hypothetical protein
MRFQIISGTAFRNSSSSARPLRKLSSASGRWSKPDCPTFVSSTMMEKLRSLADMRRLADQEALEPGR